MKTKHYTFISYRRMVCEIGVGKQFLNKIVKKAKIIMEKIETFNQIKIFFSSTDSKKE